MRMNTPEQDRLHDRLQARGMHLKSYNVWRPSNKIASFEDDARMLNKLFDLMDAGLCEEIINVDTGTVR